MTTHDCYVDFNLHVYSRLLEQIEKNLFFYLKIVYSNENMTQMVKMTKSMAKSIT